MLIVVSLSLARIPPPAVIPLPHLLGQLLIDQLSILVNKDVPGAGGAVGTDLGVPGQLLPPDYPFLFFQFEENLVFHVKIGPVFG